MRWAFLSKAKCVKTNCRPKPTPRRGFQRSNSQLRNRITADASSGFKAEAGRYHPYLAYNCPRAHRTLIFRALKKRERAITVAYALPASASTAGCSGVTRSFRSVPRILSMRSAISIKPTRPPIRTALERLLCRPCGTPRRGG